ncbi:hypothetical protein LSAT2_019010 [Lamellibrachia satsuma]|nr:hypothetical protein LSAT2_019010 [Lamellibrachia satsuma]
MCRLIKRGERDGTRRGGREEGEEGGGRERGGEERGGERGGRSGRRKGRRVEGREEGEVEEEGRIMGLRREWREKGRRREGMEERQNIQRLLHSTPASSHCSSPQQHPATAPVHSSIQTLLQSTAASRHCSSPQQHPDTAPAHSSIQTLLHSTAASNHCFSPQQHPATAAVHSSIQTLLQSTAASRDCSIPQQYPDTAACHSSIHNLSQGCVGNKEEQQSQKSSWTLRERHGAPYTTASQTCQPTAVGFTGCKPYTGRTASIKLLDLVQYLENTWITSTSRPSTPWTTFKRSVRTTNDADGWHYRLNKSAPHDDVDMYLLSSRASTAAATAGNVSGPEETLPSSEKTGGVVDSTNRLPGCPRLRILRDAAV